MKQLSFWFLVSGVITVLIGMIWGIQMSASTDHTMAPAHAHLNLLGFVSFAIFAFYYQLVEGADQGTLPKLHFLLAVLSVVIGIPGIAMAIAEKGDMLAKLGSVIALVSMFLFLFIVVRSGRSA